MLMPFSYSQTTFSKAFDVLNNHDYGDELELIDGNYYITGRGRVQDSTNNTYTYPDYFFAIDSGFNEINKFIFRDGFYGTDFLYDSDTLYYLGFKGNIWNIYKFNLQGDSLDMLVIDTFRDSKWRPAPLTIYGKGDYFYIEGRIDGNEKKGFD